MEEKWWERPAWFVNDNWWIILLIIALGLGIYFTTDEWLPLFGKNPVSSKTTNPLSFENTLAAEQTSNPVETTDYHFPTVTTTPEYIHFNGFGYNLEYPSNWYLSQPGTDSTGATYDFLLSDAAGNKGQQASTQDEQARVTIFYLPADEISLETWILERWSWMNTNIVPDQIGGVSCFIATISVDNPSRKYTYYWLENNSYVYVISAYSVTSDPEKSDQVQRVVSSIVFK